MSLVAKIWNMLPASGRNIAELQHTVSEQQTLIDVLLGDFKSTSTAGNPYPSYSEKTHELSKKYAGESDWGNHLAQNLIEQRAAFILGTGITPKLKGGFERNDRELEYIREFLSGNNLDQETSFDWAKEAEIEGKFLAKLWPNQQTRQVDARFIPWTQHEYTVQTEAEDYAVYTGVTYRVGKTGMQRTLKPAEFVFKRFYGRTNRVNLTPSRVANVLAEIEALDKALKDWRKINHLFAAPTPHFKAESAQHARQLYDWLKNLNWKIGKMLVTTAEFTMVGPPTSGIDSLEKEITTNAKIISGSTGIPVHFLGLPELMSNRATADNLMETLGAATEKERHIWIGLYEELFRRVLEMANANFQTGFAPEAVGAEIPPATSAKLQELNEVWLPIYESGAISQETLLAHIPGLDVEEEMERMRQAEEQRSQQAIGIFNRGGQGGSEDDEDIDDAA